jgi:hypothetical protein
MTLLRAMTSPERNASPSPPRSPHCATVHTDVPPWAHRCRDGLPRELRWISLKSLLSSPCSIRAGKHRWATALHHHAAMVGDETPPLNPSSCLVPQSNRRIERRTLV